jgi:putative ABC transport system permease protein
MISGKWRELMRDVLEGLRSQPGRTSLSFLGVGIGVLALTILLTVLDGLRQKSQLLLEEFGAHVFSVAPATGPDQPQGAVLTERELGLLGANLPACRFSRARRFSEQLGAPSVSVAVWAVDEMMPVVRRWKMVRGRFFDREDCRRSVRYAVISRAMSRRQGLDVGRTVTVRKTPFEIIGVVDSGGRLEGADAADLAGSGEYVVFVPCTVARQWEASPVFKYDTVFVQVPAGQSLERHVEIARRVLSSRQQGASGYAWMTPDVLLAGIRKWQKTIAFTAGSVALLCLVLGGTTMMSLLVANVRDRMTEIGLRRALGAMPADVAALFVMEGCLITGSAALVASTLAHLLLWLFRPLLPVPVHLTVWTWFVPVVVSLGMGVLFSHGPARMAARIQPADALRAE